MREHSGSSTKSYCTDAMLSGVWLEFKPNVEFLWLKFIAEVALSRFPDTEVKEELTFFCTA